MFGRLKKTGRGFTIVELLVVIVVIAVLASVAIVSYRAIQTRANNTARYNEMKTWEKIFRVYATQNSVFPPQITSSVSDTQSAYFCLGTNFPKGGSGVERCRDYLGTNDSTYSTSPRESKSASLNTEIKNYASIPDSAKKPVGDTVGPYVRVYEGTPPTILEITQVFESSRANTAADNECPKGTNFQFFSNVNDKRLWCEIHLEL